MASGVEPGGIEEPAEISSKCLRGLYVFGGDVSLVAQASIGPVAFPVSLGGRDMDIRCDIALVTVDGATLEGYSTGNLAEASMMRSMIERANKVAILADSSKFDRRHFVQITELDVADWFVTDKEPPPDLAAALQHHGVEVVTKPIDQTS